jgi:hypothetical protein
MRSTFSEEKKAVLTGVDSQFPRSISAWKSDSTLVSGANPGRPAYGSMDFSTNDTRPFCPAEFVVG